MTSLRVIALPERFYLASVAGQQRKPFPPYDPFTIPPSSVSMLLH